MEKSNDKTYKTSVRKMSVITTISRFWPVQGTKQRHRRVIKSPVSWLILTFFLSLIGGTPGRAEWLNIPVKSKTTVKVQHSFEQNLQLKTDEGLLIYLDAERRFLEKIQLELIISDALKRYCDGLAVSLYSCLKPLPKDDSLPLAGKIDGKKIFFALLPYVNRTYVQIPVLNKNQANTAGAPKQNPPTKLPPGILGVTDAPQADDFPLLFLIQPVVKGMPDTVLLKDFFINIKPVLVNKGLFQFTLGNKEKIRPEEIVAHIDEELIDATRLPLVLEAGMHKLKLEAEAYKAATVTFVLNPGEQKELQLALEPDKTTLTVEAPQEAIIFFDSNKLNISPGERIEVEAGEHIIRFKIGSYSSSKKVLIQKGKNYTVNLILDIAIKED